MRFTYTVEIEVERSEGKFASRDELSEALTEMIDGANEGDIATENDATYSIISWDITEQAQAKRAPA